MNTRVKSSSFTTGYPVPMEHFMEAAVRGMGFQLVKDGKEWDENRDQEPNPTFYIKVYQLKLDNRPVALRCRFVYDLRRNSCSCEFRPSIGECLNAIAHMTIGEETDIKGEKADW